MICNQALVLRGLDALSSEESILAIMNAMCNGLIAARNLHVAREMNVSCGFAFVEFNTIQVTKKMYSLNSGQA